MAPATDVPEHIAYPDYEVALLRVIGTHETRRQRMQNDVDEARQRHLDAETAYREALVVHRENRAAAGVFGKLTNVINETVMEEKTEVTNAERDLAEASQQLAEHDVKLQMLRDEQADVTQWLDDMYATTLEAGQLRQENREAAARDLSFRTFTVFTMREYLDGDERRRLRWDKAPEMPGGADFGYHWRRDGDDTPTFSENPRRAGKGNWHAVWIAENKETAVFNRHTHGAGTVVLLGTHIKTMDEAMDFFVPLESRQTEHNSLAVLFDAYAEAYLRP